MIDSYCILYFFALWLGSKEIVLAANRIHVGKADVKCLDHIEK